MLFFFFQAEDGIRDLTVTGVQTCALPIWRRRWGSRSRSAERRQAGAGLLAPGQAAQAPAADMAALAAGVHIRSEERRVGKSVDLGGRRIIKKKKERRYVEA